MKLLLAVALLVTAARAASLVGSDKCTWGPSYWCSSLPAASTCSALQLCVNTTWAAPVAAIQESPECKFSQKVIQTVRQVIANDYGQVKEEATHLLASICRNIEDATARQACKGLVTDYLPEVMQVIQSNIDEERASVVLGLCREETEEESDGGETQAEEVSVTYAPPTNQTICEDCRAFVGDLGTLISQPGSEDRFLQVMDDICADFGPLEVLCKSFVETQLPNVFQFLADNDNPETVCRLVDFCLQTEKVKWHHLVDDIKYKWKLSAQHFLNRFYESDEVILCGECQKSMEAAISFTKHSSFRNTVEKGMADLCALTTVGEKNCHTLATTLPGDLVAFLTRNLDTENICTETLMCTKSHDEEQLLQKEVAPLMPANDCGDCEKFFLDVQAILRDSNSPPQAAALAKQVICQSAGPLEFECNGIMEAGMPAILDFLAKEDNPSKICAALTICPKSNDQSKTDIVKLLTHAWEKEPLRDFKCEECATLVEDARSMDRSPDFQKGVVTFLNEMCAATGREEKQCKALVEQYAPELFQILASELDPELVCETFLHCTKPEGSEQEDEQEEEEEEKPYEVEEMVYAGADMPAATVPNVHFKPLTPQPTQPSAYYKKYKKSKQNSAIYDWINGSEREEEIEAERQAQYEREEEEDEMRREAEEEEEEERKRQEAEEEEKKRKEEEERKMKGEEEERERNEEDDVGLGESVECAICKLAMETLDKEIGAESTQEEIERAVDTLCDILPSTVKAPCDAFVANYTPAIIDLVLQELDPLLICNELQICNDTQPVEPIHDSEPETDVVSEVSLAAAYDEERLVAEIASGPRASIECQICELVVGSVDTIIGENRSEAAIQSALDKICTILPSGIQSQCLSFVNEYASVVIQLLLQELEPQAVCVKIGLCDPSTLSNEEAPREEEREERVGGPLCSLCEQVMGLVDEGLAGNTSTAAVEKVLNEVCSKLPASLTDDCNALVATYTPAILNLIAVELDPKLVCTELDLCNAAQRTKTGEGESEGEKKEEEERRMKERVEAGEWCQLCQNVTSVLADALKDNKSEPAVEKALREVCEVFPYPISSECRLFMKQFAPAVINLLINEVDPKAICIDLGLCNRTKTVEVGVPLVKQEKKKVRAGDDVKCQVCKAIVTEINTIIGKERTEQAIIRAVEVVCDAVSGDLKLECKSEIENYGPAVIDLLQHLDDPDTVCSELNVCPAQKKTGVSRVALKEGEGCLICRTLANYAKEGLNEQSTVAEVTKLLEDVCSALPQQYQSECVSLVDQMTPLVIHYLATKDDPLQVCTALGLCASDNASLQPALGVDGCTFGPAYWCANLDNARQCQAVDECVEKYHLKA